MFDRSSLKPARHRVLALLLLGVLPSGLILGCGSGADRSDRAMIDPGKAATEQKAAEDAQRQNYTKDKLKAQNPRR